MPAGSTPTSRPVRSTTAAAAGRAEAANWIPAGAAVLSGFCLAAAFPPLGWSVLGWIALVPLGAVAMASRPARAARLGLLAGGVWFALLLFWLLQMIVAQSQMPAVLAVVPFMLLVAYLALHPLLFALLLSALARRSPRAALLAGPALWTGLEYVRGTALSGFPWGLLGASQQPVPMVAQFAALTGVYGLSFVLAAFNFALLAGVSAPRRRARPFVPIAIAAGILLAVLGWGLARLAQPAPAGEPLQVACVQGNGGPDPDLDEGPELLSRYESMTREARRAGAALVLWPESNTPYLYEIDAGYRDRIRALAAETGATLIFGSIGGPLGGPYANSAYVVRPGPAAPVGGPSAGPAPGGAAEDPRYDKRHLVPYGEYVPLGTWMPFVRRFVNAIGDFQPGTAARIWDVGSLRLAPLICYEAIFPPLAREDAAAGATALINLTNDGWYGHSPGPEQHLQLAALRAVETARPLVRCANTGISAIYDARGVERARTELEQPALLAAAITPGTESTLYARTGDWLPMACVIITLLTAGFAWRERKH